jgi:hypothetical protein
VRYSPDDVAYDHLPDRYICPAGKGVKHHKKEIYRMLRPLAEQVSVMRYRSSKLDFDGCLLRPQCC